MSPEEIKQFNKDIECVYDTYNQGIFSEPNNIPVHIKEPVVYLRYETGGMSGGSCWDDSDPQPYTERNLDDNWVVLDKFLEIYCPQITYLQYKKIEELVHTNKETDYEYYGNSTDYVVRYIKLSELEKLVKDF